MTKDQPQHRSGIVHAMHSDARIAPKLDVAVRAFEDARTVFRNGIVLELIDRYVEMLQLVRFAKDDDLVATTASRMLDMLADMEVFFGELPIEQPHTLEELKQHAANLKRFHETQADSLHATIQQLQTHSVESKQRLEDLQRVDRRNLAAMHQMIGNRINRLVEVLEQAKANATLAEQIKTLTAEKQTLETQVSALRTEAAAREFRGIEELIGRFEQTALLLTADTEGSAAAKTQIADLSRQLQARMEWLQECALKQSEAEDAREEISFERSELEQVTRFGTQEQIAAARERAAALSLQFRTLNAYIERLVALQEQERRKLTPIKRYCEAYAQLQRGVSAEVQNVLSMPMPEIPELSTIQSPEANESTDLSISFTRRSVLERLAADHKFSIGAVLLLTLFEVLPRGKRFSKGQRGLLSVNTAAKKVGIFQAFGDDTEHEAFTIFRGTGASFKEHFGDLLMYRGSVRNRHMYMRTDIALPWAVTEVLTEEEIQEFRTSIESWKPTDK